MPLPFSAAELAWIAAAMLFAGFVKGVTGLGYSTTCLPLLALALGLKTGLPLVLAPSLASNLAVMAGAGPARPALRRFWPMLALAPAGVLLGTLLLARVSGEGAGAALGAALIAWCAFAAARPHWRLPAGLERPLAPAVGLATGLVNGVTGSQVLPVTPFLMSLGLPRELFVMALNLSFTLSSLAMAAGLARLGLLTPAAAAVSAAGIAAAIGGVRLGARLRRRLPETAFRGAVLVLLALAGAALLARWAG